MSNISPVSLKQILSSTLTKFSIVFDLHVQWSFPSPLSPTFWSNLFSLKNTSEKLQLNTMRNFEQYGKLIWLSTQIWMYLLHLTKVRLTARHFNGNMVTRWLAVLVSEGQHFFEVFDILSYQLWQQRVSLHLISLKNRSQRKGFLHSSVSKLYVSLIYWKNMRSYKPALDNASTNPQELGLSTSLHIHPTLIPSRRYFQLSRPG